MNTIRMFAFVAAVLITIFLFRVIADAMTEKPAVVGVTSEASSTDHPRAGD
jgi:hypothetical protein